MRRSRPARAAAIAAAWAVVGSTACAPAVGRAGVGTVTVSLDTASHDAAPLDTVPLDAAPIDTVPLDAAPIDTPAFDRRAHAAAVRRLPPSPVPMPGIRALVVPHHWPAGDLIVAGLRDAAATGRFARIVLLAPDHAHAGRSPATTSGRGWTTPFGNVRGDAAAVESLARTGIVRRDDAVIRREHGIGGLVPAVAHTLPDAAIVPVAVRNDVRAAEVEAIGAVLAGFDMPDTLFVLSVDLSHGLAPNEARRMDAATLAALAALDGRRVLGFGAEHLDARGAAAALFHVLRRHGATRFVARARADASDFPGYEGGPATSYVVGYYARSGPASGEARATRPGVMAARPAHP